MNLKADLKAAELDVIHFLAKVEGGIEVAVKWIVGHPAVINSIESDVKAAIVDLTANNTVGIITDAAKTVADVKEAASEAEPAK